MQIKNRKSDFFFGLNNISLVCQVNVFCERAIFWKKTSQSIYCRSSFYFWENVMKKMKKYLFALLGVFLSGVMVSSTIFAEDLTSLSSFDLWGGVQATWDSGELKIVKNANPGDGKIDRIKWNDFKNRYDLATKDITISFAKNVRFPDDASGFFKDFQSRNITFEEGMKTDNLKNMGGMFSGAVNFNTDISWWDVSGVWDMGALFAGAEKFNQPLKNRDTSKVYSMNYMFDWATAFNQPLTNWDTSNVVTMYRMFYKATSFNSDVSGWDLRKVTKLEALFAWASSFNQPLTNWKTSNKLKWVNDMFGWASAFNQDLSCLNMENVVTFARMFHWATSFNQPLNGWNTRNVTDMNNMFHWATSFNQPLNNWNTSNVTHTFGMFYEATSFNQDISNWDTSNVKDMHLMFFKATSFNQPLNDWDTHNVKDMRAMFAWATSFNQPLNDWKTSNVQNMSAMFDKATSFNQNLSKWNTSQVTGMIGMFREAKVFTGSGLEKWNVEKVENMSDMFQNAFSFNADISDWNPKSLMKGYSFIYRTDKNGQPLSFSRENYEWLLYKWNNKLTNANREFNLAIEAPYCNQKEDRDSLIEKGYKIYWDRRECGLKVEDFDSKLKESNHTITDTFTVTSFRDQEAISVQVVGDGAGANAEVNCTVKTASPWEKECSLVVKSTEQGRNVKVKITDGVTTKIIEGKYLIDNKGPELPQVHINTDNGVNLPRISLPQFPADRWGAGVESCLLSYVNRAGQPMEYDLKPGNENAVELSDLEELSDHHKVHTMSVQCKDRLWNPGDINTIKFPPIIEFSSENKTLISKGTFEGRFTLYSPGSESDAADIAKFVAKATGGVHFKNIRCSGKKDPIESRELQGIGQGSKDGMSIKNDKGNKVECFYEGEVLENGDKTGKLSIEVTDVHGAQGNNSQSFTIDDKAPEISISPEQLISSGNITLKITITDDHKLDPNSIRVNGEEVNQCSKISDSEVVCDYTIPAPAEGEVKKSTITIDAKDSAGNPVHKESAEFTIDRVGPVITPNPINYETNGTVAKLSFTAEDNYEGVGLRTQDEQNDPNFDRSAVGYFFSDQEDCANPEEHTPLFPGSTAFEITDTTKHGRYVCLQVKDKVWNQSSKSLGKLDFNLPPKFDQSHYDNNKVIIPDTTSDGTSILDLKVMDPNPEDSQYYTLDGDDDKFEIVGNQLKVKWSFNFQEKNQYDLDIIVRDREQDGLSDKISVKIVLDQAPTIDLSTKEVSTRKGKNLNGVTFTVKDNDAVGDIEVVGLPDGVNFNVTEVNSKEKKVSFSGAPKKSGTYTVTVKARDNQWNETTEKITITVKPKNWWGVSSSVSVVYDNCPNGDHSGSRTDGKCEALQVQINTGKNNTEETEHNAAETKALTEIKAEDKPELVEGKTKYQDTVIFNPTIENGKCYTRREYLGIKDSETLVTSEEFKKALSFLRSYEMTMFDSVEGFAPKRNLSREEAAKIFSNFAINVLCRKPDTNLSVNYSDVENANPTLKPYITLAYQLGVMKGSGMGDGKFRPFDAISKAEVNAVLIRMILKSYLDENKSENKVWYSEYNKVATDLGIINQGAGAEPVLRNNVALMLFRAYKHQVFDWRNVDYFSYVLKSRDLFVK